MQASKAIIVITLLGSFSVNLIADDEITRASGGSIKTELGYGIVTNEGSSLTREWITVHDNSIPADINGTIGVKTVYESGDRYSRGDYRYSTQYRITVKESLSVIEVRFLLFDIWGDHVRNLSSTDIIDIDAGATKAFDAKWNVYSENEVSEYYASIAYISQVRTNSGKVVKANSELVLEQAKKFSKKFTESDLEPNPEKE